NPVATIASSRAPCGPRLTEIRGSQVAASPRSRRRADEVGVVEQVEEVGLERYSRLFIEIEILGDVEVYVSPGRTDQTVALDRRVAPQSIIDRSAASEGNPICIEQTLRRISVQLSTGDDSALGT